MKLCHVASLVVVLSAGPAVAATTITGGNVVNQTWTAAGSPYIVQGDVTIPSGATLTIEAGTTIQFPGGDMQGSGLNTTKSEITVRGTLAVHGTAASPVTFAGSAPSDWYGFVVDTTATSVTIDHAIVSNAYTGLTYDAPGNVMSGFGLEIDDASYEGLDVEAGSPAFDGLVVRRARSYGVYVTSTGSLALTNCVVAGTGNSSGIYVTTTATSTVTVTNCTLDRNYYGIYDTGSGLSTVTVTSSIVTNSASYGVLRATSVTYSDVWGNGTDYGNTTAGTGCMSANPQYVGTDDYHLQPSSIAIDAATTGPDHDADDHVRPTDGDGINGAQPDMGAYEAGSTMTAPGDAGVTGDAAGPGDDGGALDDACIGCDPANPDGGANGGGNGDQPGAGGGCCDAGHSGDAPIVWIAIVGLALAGRRRPGKVCK